MITEYIYSPIEDKDIKNNLQNSPIWKEAYKLDESFPDKKMYFYKIRFDGLTPVQVMQTGVL